MLLVNDIIKLAGDIEMYRLLKRVRENIIKNQKEQEKKQERFEKENSQWGMKREKKSKFKI